MRSSAPALPATIAGTEAIARNGRIATTGRIVPTEEIASIEEIASPRAAGIAVRSNGGSTACIKNGSKHAASRATAADPAARREEGPAVDRPAVPSTEITGAR